MALNAKQKRDLSEYDLDENLSGRCIKVYRHQDDERHIVLDSRPEKERIIKRFPSGELSWNKAERLAYDLDQQAMREEW